MRPRSLLRRLDERRLAVALTILAAALALPSAVLIYQGWSQLKWEAFHRYRGLAEELSERIDADLADRIAAEEARSFADYRFLVVAGDPGATVLQRSPLAAFPVASEVPGVLGYFQVDGTGDFTTPVLPDEGAAPAALGIPEAEYRSRAALAADIRGVLANNRLLGPVTAAAAKEEPAAPRAGRDTPGGVSSVSGDDADYSSQREFDRLASRPPATSRIADIADIADIGDSARNGEPAGERRQAALGKLADLELDEKLEQKSQAAERSDFRESDGPKADARRPMEAVRARRVEMSAAPAGPAVPVPSGSGGEAPLTTFESEVDPFEFSLLDSGHLVLFRKVWRDGERYVQGMLIDRSAFLADTVERPFQGASVAGMSELIVAYHDDIIAAFDGARRGSYTPGQTELAGTLLYKSRLSAPFDSLSFVFSVRHLPPGPGAGVLGWASLVLAVVLLGGFYALYRLGVGQIRLARQQRDFVSAVSHELKTPLTSIRMYGEMLREGWADEGRRQTYYEYIHDEAERLTRLVANVLQLARISRSEPRPDPRPRAVGPLLEEVRSKIDTQVRRAGFTLTLRDDAAEAMVCVDDDGFLQILINLVDNALKFSRDAERKVIEIAGTRNRDGGVTISVRDFGPGIPPDQMKKIFGLFYRSESELTRETVGTGIGLAIVHELARAMGGEVDVVNRDPGAEFRLTLPPADPRGG